MRRAIDSIQESPQRKTEWLAIASTRFAVGTRVRIVASDLPRYVGLVGTVIGHDVGLHGEWPLVRVDLDSGEVDGFYGDGSDDDEITNAEVK